MSEAVHRSVAHVRAKWLAEQLPWVIAIEPTVEFSGGRWVVLRGIERQAVRLVHAFGIGPADSAGSLLVAHQWHNTRSLGQRDAYGRCGAAEYTFNPSCPEDATVDYCQDPNGHLSSREVSVLTALSDFAPLRSPTFDPRLNGFVRQAVDRLHTGGHPFTNELIVAGIGQLAMPAPPASQALPEAPQRAY